MEAIHTKDCPHKDIGHTYPETVTYMVLDKDLALCWKIRRWLKTKRNYGVFYSDREARQMVYELYNEIGREHAHRCFTWALTAGDWNTFARNARAKKKQILSKLMA